MIDGKALLVGINHFPNFPENDLNGCRNDVHRFSELLIEKYGFYRENIWTLEDEQATKANIIGYLKSLVDDANNSNCPGVFFEISTHGTQIVNTSTGELVDALIPSDIALDASGNDWDKNSIIDVNELSQLISALSSNKLFEAFVDACHNGMGIKEFDLQPDRKVKFMCRPVKSMAKARALEFSKARTLRSALLEKAGPAGPQNHVTHSACESTQTAADAYENGSWGGAYTTSLVKQVNLSGSGISRFDLWKHIVDDLQDRYTQHPMLNCPEQLRTYPIGEGIALREVPLSQYKSGPSLTDDQILIMMPSIIQVLHSIYKGTSSTSLSPGVPSTNVREALGVSDRSPEVLDEKKPISELMTVSKNNSVKNSLVLKTAKDKYAAREQFDIIIENPTGHPVYFTKATNGLIVKSGENKQIWPAPKTVIDHTQTISLNPRSTIPIATKFDKVGTYVLSVSTADGLDQSAGKSIEIGP
jgi:Caspase domain